MHVAHSGERNAAHHDAEIAQELDARRHDAFAACLVDHAFAWLDDDDAHACEARGDRRRQSGRTASRDDDVVRRRERHARASSTSIARSSTRMRTQRRSAFISVKESAVIHAEWISGSAMPSATTAT